jgi:hypothetical protein
MGTGNTAETDRVRRGRASEAGAAGVEMTGVSAGNVEAKKLDGPLVWGAGVISGAVPTAGATGVAEGSVRSGEEANKGGGAGGAGNQGLGVGGEVAVGVGVKGGAGVSRGRSEKEAVCEGTETTKVVNSNREEEHILGDQGLNNGRVGRGGTTTELLPLSEVMRASSGSRCVGCIT